MNNRAERRRRKRRPRTAYAERPELIVKVQLSLATTHEQRMALVYDEHRTVMGELPANESVVMAMTRGGVVRPKAYFRAVVDGAGKVHLRDEVEEQSW
jgi:hypothetical protein